MAEAEAEADAPAPHVVVKWCGTSHTINVTPSDTIADLKRKFADIEQLPSTRQRFKVQTLDRDELPDQVLLSSLQNTTLNVYGLNKKDSNIYMKTFRGHDPDLMWHVTDKRQPLMDFDDTKSGMSKGVYEAITPKTDCLLKTGDANITPIDLASFQLMSHFRHPNSVPIQNIYPSGDKYLRLVLSDSISGTLAGYIRKFGQAIIFDSTAKTFTSFFSNIIIDLCGVLDKLIAEDICPKILTLDNMYLKMVNDKPQLKVLFNSVEPIAEDDTDKEKQLENLCGNIKAFISACLTKGDVMNDATKCLFEFLGKQAANFFGSNLMLVTKSYPLSWNDERKAAYLIDVISSNIDLRPAINTCGIKWPSNEAGDDFSHEIQYIRKILEDDNNRKLRRKHFLKSKDRMEEAKKIKIHLWNYFRTFPHDLIRMVRNFWKHFNTLPRELKEHLGSREGALHALEKWCPGVWFCIYNAVGLA